MSSIQRNVLVGVLIGLIAVGIFYAVWSKRDIIPSLVRPTPVPAQPVPDYPCNDSKCD